MLILLPTGMYARRYHTDMRTGEEKLEAKFFKVTPAYLTAIPGNASNGSYSTPAEINVTPLFGNGYNTNLYVIRHADFTTLNDTKYTITIPTTQGDVTIPQLGGQLSLNDRDSKIPRHRLRCRRCQHALFLGRNSKLGEE